MTQYTLGDGDDNQSTRRTMANTIELDATTRSAFVKMNDLSNNL